MKALDVFKSSSNQNKICRPLRAIVYASRRQTEKHKDIHTHTQGEQTNYSVI